MRRMLIWGVLNLGFFVVRVLAFDAATSPAHAPGADVNMDRPAHFQPSPADAEPNAPLAYSSSGTGT